MIEFSILNRGLLQGDIDKAELRFIFKEKDGKPLPSLVSSYLKGPPSLSDVGIEEVKREKGLVVYKIQSLRWTDKEHAYKASFVFEGGALPDFIVDTPTPNVRVIEHRNLIDNAFVFSIVSLFYLVFLIPVCIWVSRSESRSKFRFMNRFRSALVSMPKNTQFSKDEVEKILETYEAVTKPKPYGVRAWLKKKFNDKSSAASLSYENDSQCLRDETADAKRSK